MLGKSQNLVHSQKFGDCQPQIHGILFNSVRFRTLKDSIGESLS